MRPSARIASGGRSVIPSGNLVHNPGAEATDSSVDETSLPRWTITGHTHIEAYGPDGDMPNSVSAKIHSGKNFFVGGGDDDKSTARQTIGRTRASGGRFVLTAHLPC